MDEWAFLFIATLVVTNCVLFIRLSIKKRKINELEHRLNNSFCREKKLEEKLQISESNRSTTEKELAAVQFVVSECQHAILGFSQQFIKNSPFKTDIFANQSHQWFICRQCLSELAEEKKSRYELQIKGVKETCESALHKYEQMKKFTETFAVTAEDFFASNKTSIPYLAGMMADYLTLVYEQSATYLEEKKNPARTEAYRIRELKQTTKRYIEQYKIMEYQFSYIKNMYPILDDILDMDFHELRPDITLDDAPDPVKTYLSTEEWDELDSSDRNQLALDRYISGRKSNWQIGRDYELYIGHCYLNAGCQVDFFGNNMGLEDLGRDLIVKVGSKIHIVQCKYWSQTKQIHENHIAQLYGSSVSYCIETGRSLNDVIAILVTNTSLSPMAIKFSEMLHIQYREHVEMGDFPRIKCNIGVDEYGFQTRIYHLPMDQQYDKVKITAPEECYAYTVQEAEGKGFRRAYRWYGN